MDAIEADRLVRRYAKGFTAVRGISFSGAPERSSRCSGPTARARPPPWSCWRAWHRRAAAGYGCWGTAPAPSAAGCGPAHRRHAPGRRPPQELTVTEALVPFVAVTAFLGPYGLLVSVRTTAVTLAGIVAAVTLYGAGGRPLYGPGAGGGRDQRGGLAADRARGRAAGADGRRRAGHGDRGAGVSGAGHRTQLSVGPPPRSSARRTGTPRYGSRESGVALTAR